MLLKKTSEFKVRLMSTNSGGRYYILNENFTTKALNNSPYEPVFWVRGDIIVIDYDYILFNNAQTYTISILGQSFILPERFYWKVSNYELALIILNKGLRNIGTEWHISKWIKNLVYVKNPSFPIYERYTLFDNLVSLIKDKIYYQTKQGNLNIFYFKINNLEEKTIKNDYVRYGRRFYLFNHRLSTQKSVYTIKKNNSICILNYEYENGYVWESVDHDDVQGILQPGYGMLCEHPFPIDGAD